MFLMSIPQVPISHFASVQMWAMTSMSDIYNQEMWYRSCISHICLKYIFLSYLNTTITFMLTTEDLLGQHRVSFEDRKIFPNTSIPLYFSTSLTNNLINFLTWEMFHLLWQLIKHRRDAQRWVQELTKL